MKKINQNVLTGICFIIILLLVFILNIVIPDKTFSEEENRILQQKPAFSPSAYVEGRYEKKAEQYVNDQFIFRNGLIKIKTAFDLTMGKVESNGVYKSDDHYLIEEITKPDKEYMKNTIKGMKSFRKKYPSVKMYFMMAPNAGNILEEKLPSGVKMIDQDKIIKEFYNAIEKEGYRPVDVQKTLQKHKNDPEPLYYHTDHHWTTYGAYLAYKKAVSVMNLSDPVSYTPYVVKNDFRGTLASKSGFVNGLNDSIRLYMPEKKTGYRNSVIYYSDTKEKTTEFYQLKNLETKDAYTVFGGSNHPVYTIKTPVENNRKLLLFKDSYANSMMPFLSQNYREIVVVDPRYYFDSIDDIIRSEEITEVLFLYNANTFFSDNSLSIMLNEKTDK